MASLGYIAVALLAVGLVESTNFSETILCDPQCPLGFFGFDTKCYTIPDVTVTWGDALEFCHTFDSELIRVETEAEQNFLKSYLRGHQGSHFWIAATDLTYEGDWRWCNTMGPVVHTWWGKYQPDNKMNRQAHRQNCVTLNDRTGYLWFDDDCEQEYYFICERHIY